MFSVTDILGHCLHLYQIENKTKFKICIKETSRHITQNHVQKFSKKPVMVGSPLWRTLAQGKQPSTYISYLTRDWFSKLGTSYNLRQQKSTHLKTLTVATLNTTEHTKEHQEELTAGIKWYKTICVKLTTLKCAAIKPEIQGFKRVVTRRPHVNLPTLLSI
jgi:hypothetical protein